MAAVYGYTTATAGFEIMAISALDDLSAVVAFYRVPYYSPHTIERLCAGLGITMSEFFDTPDCRISGS